MGNIARGGAVSGLPRYLEGARYSAQWAGMPYSIYGDEKRANDYADDINTRSRMVNYLSGGSVYNPKEKGLVFLLKWPWRCTVTQDTLQTVEL
jgi:hypothetical protein